MSEQYPTQAEYQEALNEIFAHDPELYNYIMYCEAELTTAYAVTPAMLGDLSLNRPCPESQEEAYRRQIFGDK